MHYNENKRHNNNKPEDRVLNLAFLGALLFLGREKT